ncbi:MAG TPA: HNH endonuclease signature motif containing protein, partial [Kofleriaceae bacterium]|nr:HNH endonuclease signature motif containing protein [Kofleriaceae bacterium]
DVSGDALAAFRDARQRIELDVGHTLDDDELVRMLAHHALGGPSDPGRAAYQVAMTVCEQCGHGTRDGAGRTFAVEAHEVDAARCDAQVLPRAVTHVGRGGGAGMRVGGRTEVESEQVESEQVESEQVESEQIESQEVAAPPGAPRVDRATHVGRDLAEQGGAVHAVDRAARAEEETGADRQAGDAGDAGDVGEARVIESRHEPHEPIPSTHVGRAAPAASQSIPPRIRREVWRRDHGRCRVPGCRAARFLEVHHIVPRALGGAA